MRVPSLDHARRVPPSTPTEDLVARRERVLDAIGSDGAALLQGGGAAEGAMYFRQTNEFFYLTGLEVPHAYLLLDGRARSAKIYLPHRDGRMVASEGEGLSAEGGDEAGRISGVEGVAGPEQLASDLGRLLFHQPAPTLFTPLSPPEGMLSYRDSLLLSEARVFSDPWDLSVSRGARFVQTLRERYPQFELSDLSPILDEMRLVKSDSELDLLRRAAGLCGRGILEAMRQTRAGVTERQLAELAHFVFITGGASMEGSPPIVAVGENIWHPHHLAGDRPLGEGELVLMDYAPDYRYYTSDIGRMWPVDGVYGPVQRELYGFVVAYHRCLLRHIRVGVTSGEILDEAAAEMERVVDETAFSRPAYEKAARDMLGFPGHLSHPVGMAVHDVGDYASGPLVPGLVFSVDPQMWVPEEELYVRVEDTIAITKDGPENLTGFVPHELDEVEALVGSGRDP